MISLFTYVYFFKFAAGEAGRPAVTTKTHAVSAAVLPWMIHIPYKQHDKLLTFMLTADLRHLHLQLISAQAVALSLNPGLTFGLLVNLNVHLPYGIW